MYQIFLPHPRLRPYVQLMWSLRLATAQATVEEAVPVDGCADLMLCGATPYVRTPHRGTDAATLRSNLDAPRRQPVQIRQSGPVEMFAVRFRPGGLAPFVDAPVGTLTDTTWSVDDLFGAEGRALEAQVFEASSEDARATVVEGFLLQRLSPSRRLSNLHAILRTVDHGRGLEAVGDVALAHGLSVRSIDRLCHRYLGLSPKFYSRVVRLRAALADLGAHADLTEIALRAGFYDHAHFSNECRSLTGTTPSGWRAGVGTPSAAAPIVHSFQARSARSS